MKKQGMKTYADAHNHLNGILSAEAIKIMLSEAKKNWDKNPFNTIPEELVPTSKTLSFSNTSLTNDYGWIDCLDVLSRLIVFTAWDLKQDQTQSKNIVNGCENYRDVVKNMLFIADDNGIIKSGSGRGMNSAGLLLSGCITLRCLLDFFDKNVVNEIEVYFDYLKDLKNELVPFEEMYWTSCLIDVDGGINKKNWLFNKFEIDNLDPFLHACAEQVAISSVTAALSTSLWSPFDDTYALRSLVTRGKFNKRNYLMLTLRWLLENEAVRGNYFAEISIGMGDLAEIYNTIVDCAGDFGLKPITTGGINPNDYSPLVIQSKETNLDSLNNNKLYLRFLSGCVNSSSVRCNMNDIEFNEEINNNLTQIGRDKVFGCWAGIDMFGTENFVYNRSYFTKWLTIMYNELGSINKDSGGKRNLWLRPHVGEGSWAENLSFRVKRYDGNPRSLAKKLKSLSEFFQRCYVARTNLPLLNEVLEFIFRSIFTGWLPIDDVRKFYGISAFSFPELSNLSALLQPLNPSNGLISEKIGEANLETMIDWVNHISALTIENHDKYAPQIRFGHGTHLGFDSVWAVITDLQTISFTSIWVDLNLGSNVVTAARPLNYTIRKTKSNKSSRDSYNVESLLKEVLDKSRFTCGYIQTEMIERSERIAKFMEMLANYGVKFVLGTDGQGTELTSLFTEQMHFKNLVYWYYKNTADAEIMNKRLKNNTVDYIKYSLENLSD